MIDLNEIYSILIEYVPREISQIIIKYTYVDNSVILNIKNYKKQIYTGAYGSFLHIDVLEKIFEYINIKQNSINIWDKEKIFIKHHNNKLIPFGVLAISEEIGYILMSILYNCVTGRCNILGEYINKIYYGTECDLKYIIDDIIKSEIELESTVIINNKEWNSFIRM